MVKRHRPITVSLTLLIAAILGAFAFAGSPALASHLSCGDTITTDAKLDGDLVNCPNNGIVIGADGITLDLNGHSCQRRRGAVRGMSQEGVLRRRAAQRRPRPGDGERRRCRRFRDRRVRREGRQEPSPADLLVGKRVLRLRRRRIDAEPDPQQRGQPQPRPRGGRHGAVRLPRRPHHRKFLPGQPPRPTRRGFRRQPDPGERLRGQRHRHADRGRSKSGAAQPKRSGRRGNPRPGSRNVLARNRYVRSKGAIGVEGGRRNLVVRNVVGPASAGSASGLGATSQSKSEVSRT